MHNNIRILLEKPVPVLILHVAMFTCQQCEVNNKTVAPITSLTYFYLEALIFTKILSLFWNMPTYSPCTSIKITRYCCLSRHLFNDFTGFMDIVPASAFTLNIKYQL